MASQKMKRDLMVLCGAVVLSLVLFVEKAVHIDDPLFIWMAQQIARAPFDPFGFSVNWFGVEESVIEVMKNPPLGSYFLALVGSIAGWSEMALHSASILPALGFVLAVYWLAMRFGVPALDAALMVFFAPGVFVSSTTLMPDVMMACLWMWAMVFWMKGVDEDKPHLLGIGAVAATLASLTKYVGIAVVPLMALYAVASKRRLDPALWYVMIPIVFMLLYNGVTDALYGRPMFVDAMMYAKAGQGFPREGPWKAPTTLAFIGACAGVLFVLPSLLARRRLFLALFGIAILMTGVPLALSDVVGGENPFWLETALQFLLWCSIGGFVMILPVIPLVEQKGVDSLLLATWIFGVFVFTAFFNWSINAKTLLPLIPPLVILLLQQRERFATKQQGAVGRFVPIVLSAALGFAVAWGDLSFANAARTAAHEVQRIVRADTSAKHVLFQGHWGFQYYMQQAGYQAQTMAELDLVGVDILVIPGKNTNLFGLDRSKIKSRIVVSVPFRSLVTTVDLVRKAGFYSDFLGYLPFVFGRFPNEKYHILFLREGAYE